MSPTPTLSTLSLPTTTDANTAYNAAINFAVEHAGISAREFLHAWREGDWKCLVEEWPEFKGPVPAPAPAAKQSAALPSAQTILKAFEGANFGPRCTPQEHIERGALKVACGYTNGSTLSKILVGLGLLHFDGKLTAQGQQLVVDTYLT